LAGINAKSLVNPQVGLKSDQRKYSQVVVELIKELSLNINEEQPESSLNINDEQNQLSISIDREEYRLIDMLSFEKFGWNSIRNISKVGIQEAYGIDLSSSHGSIKVIKKATSYRDELLAGLTSLDLDMSDVTEDLSYSMLNIVGYFYDDDVAENTSVSDFAMHRNWTSAFKVLPSTIYIPDLPLIQNYKIYENATTNLEFTAAACGVIEVPLICSKIGGTDHPESIQSTYGTGDDIVYIDGIFYPKSLPSGNGANYDSVMNVNGDMNPITANDSAKATATFGSTSKRSASKELRGMKLKFTCALTYTDPVLIYCHKSGRLQDVYIDFILKDDLSRIPESDTERLKGLALYLIPSWSEFIADCGAGKWDTLFSDLDTYITSDISLLPNYRIKLYDQRDSGVASFYWSNMRVENQAGAEILPPVNRGTELGFAPNDIYLDTAGEVRYFQVEGKSCFNRQHYYDSSKVKHTYNDSNSFGWYIGRGTWKIDVWGDRVNEDFDERDSWLTYWTVAAPRFHASIELVLDIYVYDENVSNWVLQTVTDSVFSGSKIDTNTACDCCIKKDITDTYTNKIIDPALISGSYIGSWFLTNLILQDQISDGKYDVNTIQSGMGFDADQSVTVYSGTNILNMKDIPATSEAYFVSVNNLDESVNSITEPITIDALVKIDQDKFITSVRYAENKYYFGILDTTKKIHYTPRNIFFAGTTAIFANQPYIRSIEVIDYTESGFTLMVDPYYISSGIEYDYDYIYITFLPTDKIDAAVFIGNEKLKTMSVHEQYVIKRNDDKISNPFIPITKSVKASTTSTVLKGKSVEKYLTIYDSDGNLTYGIVNNQKIQLPSSGYTMFPSFSIMNKALSYIYDGALFALASIKFPILYPSSGYCCQIPDVIDVDYEEVTSEDRGLAVNNLYLFHNLLMNYSSEKNSNLSYDGMPQTGSLNMITLPAIDPVILNYSILPERFDGIYGISSQSLMTRIGRKVINTNEKSYVVLNKNIYESSNIKLIRKNDIPLLNNYGEIKSAGQYIISINDEGTYLYAIDRYSKASLIKMIPDIAIHDPLVFPDPSSGSEDVMIICRGGIYSVRNSLIYKFEYGILKAIIKPVEGMGYMLMCYSDERLAEAHISTADGTVFYCGDEEYPTLETLDNNYLFFIIYENESISKLEFVDNAEHETYNNAIVQNNLYNSNIASINKLISCLGGENKIQSIAYHNEFHDTQYHSNIYVQSGEVTLRTENHQTGWVVGAILYTRGYGTARLIINDGETELSNVQVTISTTGNSTDELKETYIDTGIINYGNNIYKLSITPGTNDSIEIMGLKFIIQYSDGDNKWLQT